MSIIIIGTTHYTIILPGIITIYNYIDKLLACIPLILLLLHCSAAMTVRRIKTPTSRKARTMPIASHIISVGRLPPPWGVPSPLSMVVAVEAMVSMLDVSCIVYKDGTVSSRLR